MTRAEPLPGWNQQPAPARAEVRCSDQGQVGSACSLLDDVGRPTGWRGSQRGVDADDLAERVQVWFVGGERVESEALMALG